MKGSTFSEFLKLRQRIRNSSFLDFETFGINPHLKGSAIWEASLLERQGDQFVSLLDTVVAPHSAVGINQDQTIKFTPIQEIPSEANKFLAKTGGILPTLEQMHKEGMHPAILARRLRTLTQGKTVFIQNLPFESRWLASILSQDQWNEYAQQLESYPVYRTGEGQYIPSPSKRIGLTNPELDIAVSNTINRAYATPQEAVTPWRGIYEKFKSSLINAPEGLTQFQDIQVLSRSMFGMAQEQGLMPLTGDIMSGTNVDVFAEYWLGQKEIHRASADNRLEALMLETYTDLAEKLYQNKTKPTTFTQEELGFFSFLGKTQKNIAERNITKTLLEAYTTGRYEAALESKRITTDFMDWTGEIHSKSLLQRDKASRQTLTSMDEVVSFMQSQYKSRGVQWDVKGIWEGLQKKFPTKEVAKAGMEEYLSTLESGIAYSGLKSADLAAIHKTGSFAHLLEYNKGRLAKIGLGLGALALFGHTFWSADDEYIQSEGMQHGWFGSQRKFTSEFGSGYTGPQENISRIALEGFTSRYMGPYQVITLQPDELSVEDADTILIGALRDQAIRLEGIDAPEVTHGIFDIFGQNQDQPYGEAAKKRLQSIIDSQRNLTIILSGEKSKGRGIGIILGQEGQNINLQMIREGQVRALPFGPQQSSMQRYSDLKRAEQQAQIDNLGMWQNKLWQNIHALDPEHQITNVSYTMPERIYQDPGIAMAGAEMQVQESLAGQAYYGLGLDQPFSFMNPSPNYPSYISPIPDRISSKDDDYVQQEGMTHGWFGNMRKHLSDFGSGWLRLVRYIPTETSSLHFWGTVSPKMEGALNSLRYSLEELSPALQNQRQNIVENIHSKALQSGFRPAFELGPETYIGTKDQFKSVLGPEYLTSPALALKGKNSRIYIRKDFMDIAPEEITQDVLAHEKVHQALHGLVNERNTTDFVLKEIQASAVEKYDLSDTLERFLRENKESKDFINTALANRRTRARLATGYKESLLSAEVLGLTDKLNLTHRRALNYYKSIEPIKHYKYSNKSL